MAGTAVSRRSTATYGGDFAELKTTVNRLIDDLEALRAAYVLHQHAALNAALSTNTVAAATLTAYKINDT